MFLQILKFLFACFYLLKLLYINFKNASLSVIKDYLANYSSKLDHCLLISIKFQKFLVALLELIQAFFVWVHNKSYLKNYKILNFNYFLLLSLNSLVFSYIFLFHYSLLLNVIAL